MQFQSRIISEHTVHLTLLNIRLRRKRLSYVLLLTKYYRQIPLNLAFGHRDWTMDYRKRVASTNESRFILQHHARFAVFYKKCYFPSCKKSYTGHWCRYLVLRNVLRETLVVIEKIKKAADYLIIIADNSNHYTLSVFRNGNRVLDQDNVLFHRIRIILDWFREHNTGFQSRSWPSNSLDLKAIEKILYVSQEFKNNHFRIFWICMTATWTYCIIYLQSFAKDMWHPCQGELQLF